MQIKVFPLLFRTVSSLLSPSLGLARHMDLDQIWNGWPRHCRSPEAICHVSTPVSKSKEWLTLVQRAAPTLIRRPWL